MKSITVTAFLCWRSPSKERRKCRAWLYPCTFCLCPYYGWYWSQFAKSWRLFWFSVCFSLIFFKWPSIFYITEFSIASITVQSTHFPAKSILRCEVPAGLCGCFSSSPQSAWGILCFKSSSFSKPFKLCQSTTVFLVWTKKGLGVCVWRDVR